MPTLIPMADLSPPDRSGLPRRDSDEKACPGSVIDHIQALKSQGSDSPENMVGQSKEEAKARDRIA